MSSLVNRKFAEWTDGLDPHQSRISIFEHICNIPYSLAVPHEELGTAVEQLLLLGRGSCGPKHYLLAEMFRRLNLNVVYATFAFLWNDPDFRYPPPLRDRAAHHPVSHHLSCRVQIGCRWVLVDATWDPPLGKAGFPVNMNWDGYSDTKCAVKPLPAPLRTAFCGTATNEPCRDREDAELCPLDGEMDHWDQADRTKYHAGKIALFTPEERNRITIFHREFDAWLESIRENT